MANDENEQLRKEVERQTRIIDTLLDNNTQLKQALNWCQHLLAHPPNPFYSNDTGADAIPQMKEAMKSGKDGANQLPDDVIFRINGVIQEFDSIQNKIIGVNNKIDTYPLPKDGVNQSLDLSAPVMVGGNEKTDIIDLQRGVPSPVNSHADMGDTISPSQKNMVSKPSPDIHDLSKTFRYNGKDVALFTNTPQDIAEGKLPVSYNKLYALLRKSNAKASMGGLVNTAQILMKLYQSPAQPMKSLQQLTHLSEDGITKRIMAMKKSGLIVRAPGRQLLLTEKAHHLLDEAR